MSDITPDDAHQEIEAIIDDLVSAVVCMDRLVELLESIERGYENGFEPAGGLSEIG